jgi:nucleoside-triphosphatase THEP1
MRDARLIYQSLLPHFKVWLDCEQLLPSTVLVSTIQNEINNADVVVILLHKGDLENCELETDFFRSELECAFKTNKKMVFILFDHENYQQIVPKKLEKIEICLLIKNKLISDLYCTINMEHYQSYIEIICKAINN